MLPTTTLAEQANQHHADAQVKAQEAVQHAIEAGRLLTQAKAALPHGEWSTWLADNFDGSDRHARRYMNLAAKVDALPDAKRTRVANLPSLRQALEAVADDEPEEKAPEKPSKPGLINMLSLPIERRREFCTRWPENLWAYAALLDKAGKGAEEIAEQTGMPLDEVARVLNPVPPARSCGEGEQQWLDLYRACYESFITCWRSSAYRSAAWHAEPEGYGELVPMLNVMADHFHQEWKKTHDRRRDIVSSIYPSEDDENDFITQGVVGIATEDARAAMGLEEPTLPQVSSITRAAAIHWLEINDAA